MKILNILFPKKKQENIVSNWQNEGMLKLCKVYYMNIKRDIQEDTLSVHSVCGGGI